MTNKRTWLGGILDRAAVTGEPDDDADKVVPLRPVSVDALLAELSAYDAQIMSARLQVERDDLAYIESRNAAARDHNALLERANKVRDAIAEHLKRYNLATSIPRPPVPLDLVTRAQPQAPLRQRREPEVNPDEAV